MFKKDLANLAGGTAFVETTAAGWGDGKSAAPQRDWQQTRIGADPPVTLDALRTHTAESVYNACGVPVSLATDSTGNARKESYRQFIMLGVEPLLKLVKDELEIKLETSIEFDLSNLWAHDLLGRATAFDKLITAGLDPTTALIQSGLLTGEG